MFLLAKVAIGCGATLLAAGAYTCREGMLNVQVDEQNHGGSHVHVWVPAALAPMVLHFVPADKLRDGLREAGPWLPTLRAFTRELRKYPDANFVEVRDPNQTVHIRTSGGKILIDVHSPDENVHIDCPLATIEDIAGELQAKAPSA
ncbi:MAG TPA: hypothetical protein VGI16_13200 [Candidatus Acidoferrum sp.]|jgi:hypothetical protein